MQNLKNLLENVAIIQSKYEDLAEYSGEHYNVFDILGVQSDELSHSAILTNLLNAKGKHGQKDIFLKLFIETVKGSFKNDESKMQLLNNFNKEGSKAEKEKYAGKVNYEAEQGGRIDIVINDGKNNIIIENKIYAGDQPLQLLRYNEFDKNAPIFYLTLDGKLPNENSAKGLTLGKEFVCISYQNEIISWLEQSIKEMTNKPLIRETLNQYLFLINSLTNQSNNNKMSEEIINVMTKNIDSSFEIYKNFNNLKKHLLISFIEKIKDKLSSELIVDFNTEGIGSKDSNITFRKNNWGNIKVLLYFNGNDFSNVILGIHEDNLIPKYKDCIIVAFKSLNFGKNLLYPNWYKLFSYERFNNIGSAEFWKEINSESFINCVVEDLEIFFETIDRTLEVK